MYDASVSKMLEYYYRWVSLNTFYRTTLGGQLYTNCHFVPGGSEQISLHCKYVLPNPSLIPYLWLQGETRNLTFPDKDTFSHFMKLILQRLTPKDLHLKGWFVHPNLTNISLLPN